MKRLKREPYLTSLFGQIQSTSYSPHPPREYIVSNKYNLVSRIVPVLSVDDICVYYFCIKSLENDIAINRIEGTYGGFRMGGPLRVKEEQEFTQIMEIPFSVPPYSYNPQAWVQAWRDFQKKALIYSAGYSCFIMFDVANFYDTINLAVLERKLRSSCDKVSLSIIDLLFYFLRNWNKRFDRYAPRTVGLPQDEVGDCSRVLANFYLQDFDESFYGYCVKRNMGYLRYADDIIVMGNDPYSTKEALFFASKELSKIGLNINPGKVSVFESKQAFSEYWAFDIFDRLGNWGDHARIEEAIDMYKSCMDKRIKFRHESVLKRLINCDITNIQSAKKRYILNLVLSDEFLANIEEHELRKIYSVLDQPDRGRLKEALEKLIPVVFFNKYHYVLLKADEIFIFDKPVILSRIKELSL